MTTVVNSRSRGEVFVMENDEVWRHFSQIRKAEAKFSEVFAEGRAAIDALSGQDHQADLAKLAFLADEYLIGARNALRSLRLALESKIIKKGSYRAYPDDSAPSSA